MSLVADSMSRVSQNSIEIDDEPSREEEVMARTPSMPLIESSRICVICASMTLAEAPL